MHPIQFDATPVGGRNKVTVFFRIFMLIPLVIVAALWGVAAVFVTIGQWFVCVFTGKRSRSMFDFSAGFENYAIRVSAYGSLLHDTFPAIASTDPASTVQFSAEYAEAVNRKTTVLRIIWAIPAFIVSQLLSQVSNALTLLSWLLILFTGQQPQSIFDFLVKCIRYQARTHSYMLLLTDAYPKFE